MRHAPAAADFTEYDAGLYWAVMHRLDYAVENGWFTAEGSVLLTDLEEKILRLVLRVKTRDAEFRGNMTAAAIAHRFRYEDPRPIQKAIKHLEEIEAIRTERRLRAIEKIIPSEWFFENERPVQRSKAPAGEPTMTPQKMREIRRRAARQAADRFEANRELRAAQIAPPEASQAVQEHRQSAIAPDPAVLERFLAERARRAAAPRPETTKKSDHVLSKSLSSERTPYPLFAAAPAAPPGGPPSTPDGNDTEERKRLGGYAASPRPTNDDRTAPTPATAQGIQRHSRGWVPSPLESILGPPG